jgi:hypothetical protein
LQSGPELWPLVAAARLDFNKLLDELPLAATEIGVNDLALSLVSYVRGQEGRRG